MKIDRHKAAPYVLGTVMCAAIIFAGYLINEALPESDFTTQARADKICKEQFGGVGTGLSQGFNWYFACYNSKGEVIRKIPYDFILALGRNK